MPAGEDPADMLEAGEAGRIRELIEEAVELPEFHVRLALDEADLSSPAGRDRALDEVVPVLAAMRESISRNELARLVADRLDADPGLVMRRVAGEPERGAAPGARVAPKPDGGGPAARADRRPRAAAERSRAARAGAPGDVHRLAGRGAGAPERLTAEHLSSPAVARARDWLAEHLEEPLRGLPREDEELVFADHSAGIESRSRAGRARGDGAQLPPARAGDDRGTDPGGAEGGGDPPVELQRRRAELAERIAHWETAGAG